MKKLLTAIFNAWLLFIGVDFLFHAGILSALWKEDIPAIKPQEELAVLIPVGYASFLLLTILIAFVFHRIYKEKPPIHAVWKFALIFGGLFALSNLLGLYSYIEIPFKHQFVFNIVYFIEIIVVTFTLYITLFSDKPRKIVIRSVLLFVLLVILGLVFQNLLG
jgi:membrane-associated HD superfamily phosphohydrolase